MEPLDVATKTSRFNPSTFITVLAWVFIVQTAMYLLGAVFHLLFLNTMLTHREEIGFGQVIRLQYLFVGILIFLAVLILFSSIQLLKRRPWARVVFIIYMGLGLLICIAYCFFSALLPIFFPQLLQNSEIPDELLTAVKFMRIAMIVGSTLFAVLFWWLLIQLLSPRVRREFR